MTYLYLPSHIYIFWRFLLNSFDDINCGFPQLGLTSFTCEYFSIPKINCTGYDIHSVYIVLIVNIWKDALLCEEYKQHTTDTLESENVSHFSMREKGCPPDDQFLTRWRKSELSSKNAHSKFSKYKSQLWGNWKSNI